MHRITFEPLEIRGDGATCRWRVEPATPLYLRCSFDIRLPAGCDGRQVPLYVWWLVVLLCLHSHWALLGPCTVCLPVRLPPGWRGFWRRLVASERTTLAAYAPGGLRAFLAGAAARASATGAPAGGSATGAAVGVAACGGSRGAAVEELACPAPVDSGLAWVEQGPQLEPPPRLTEAGSCAAAFSGGKDSLLQAALLAEAGVPLVLVATTSPMPPLADHLTDRRRQVLRDMPRRRQAELVEVVSDLRSAWKNDFPPEVGFPVSVNEVTDTFLYTASALLVAVLRGATHLFLAAEAEVQDNAELAGGAVVQHTHFMYSAATQRALAALLAPLGMRYGSLISALYSVQVQTLLWTRYGDLRDLQYSCWRVADGEATCSRCSQCLRLALTALALGDNPERMGIDLVRLLPAMRDWSPVRPSLLPARDPESGAELPAAPISRRLRRQALRSLAATPTARVAFMLAAGGPHRLLRRDTWQALVAYARLRRRLVLAAAGGAEALLAERPAYRVGFVDQIDPLLRSQVGSIFAQHFAAEPPADHADIQARGEALAAWIAAPLAGAEARAPQTDCSASAG